MNEPGVVHVTGAAQTGHGVGAAVTVVVVTVPTVVPAEGSAICNSTGTMVANKMAGSTVTKMDFPVDNIKLTMHC